MTEEPPDKRNPYLRAGITVSPMGVFAAALDDEYIGKHLRETGEWGTEEVARAAQFVTKNDEVLVVGAHIGTLAIPLARHCRHVTAIEANPWTYRLLKANIALNDAANITALHFAAGDRNETIKFVMSRANSGGSKRMPLVQDPMYFHDAPEIAEVPAHPLDEKLAGRNFALVLMDIEGSEYFAFRGMQNILRSTRALFAEFLPHHLKNVADVTPEEFVAPLVPHFDELYVFSLNRRVPKPEFAAVLREMYDKEQGDPGLLFIKAGANAA